MGVNDRTYALGLIPTALHDSENAALLKGILRGIERETLRVTAEGQLAQTPHPQALGAALTHPHITTDFSEALLEFITAPTHKMDALMEQLRNIQAFTDRNLGDEFLWNSSMPCHIDRADHIPVAQYGTTNRGKMKTVYRVGLGHRYGRIMQTVSGVHYNFSLPTAFWALLHHEEESTESLSEFTTRRYFDLIRNFRRHYWLLIYLFGASPAVASSFVEGRQHNLQAWPGDAATLFHPYATSLRMGDLGYQSKAQESLFVCYNSLDSYVKTLIKAIATPYAPYQAMGTADAQGQALQLNTGLLQIENEFYSAIRPKRTAQAGETALTALCHRGVEYIEVRCLDLDPFAPLGVTAQQIQFLDVFLLYCALQDSPNCNCDEFKRIVSNQKRVVWEGRNPEVTLSDPRGEPRPLRELAGDLLQALGPVADFMDTALGDGQQPYREALLTQRSKVDDPTLTPSAKVLASMRNDRLGHSAWVQKLSLQHRAQLAQTRLSARHERRLQDMGEESLALQANEEREEQAPFADYLRAYYGQYQACCS